VPRTGSVFGSTAAAVLSKTGHGAGLLWVVELDSEQQIQYGLVHLVICVSCVISPDGAVEG
jgi:hypothetical protein